MLAKLKRRAEKQGNKESMKTSRSAQSRKQRKREKRWGRSSNQRDEGNQEKPTINHSTSVEAGPKKKKPRGR